MLRILWERIPALALFLLIALVIALGVGVTLKKQRIEERKRVEAAGERTPVNVVILELKPTPIRDLLNLPAVIGAREAVEVKAEVEGKVVRITAREGTRLKKGDPIAMIDPRDYEIALTGAQAAYEHAKKTLARADNLYKKEIIPESEFDEAMANEKSLKARLDAASLDLERTTITSPLSGILDRLDAKEGLLLSPGSPVGLVMDINPVKVEVGIPESDVSAVRALNEFDLTVDAIGGMRLRGKKLLEVVKRSVAEGLSIPLYAVLTQGERRFVYVEQDGIAHTRDVETGILEGWRIQVTKGLNAGDRVIVVGHRSVSEGQGVKVIRSVGDPLELQK
jgi:membrane fusion protein (multidrug efflux system)